MVFLTAEWRRLVMLNFRIEPEALRAYTPRGTEVDSWNGNTFISLVAFQFLNTRVKGVAVPFHRNFEEINLRFYVRARGPEGWRRGVVFIKEVVPRAAIATVARWVYNENYRTHATRSIVVDPSPDAVGSAEYGWKVAGKWISLTAHYTGAATLPPPHSQEEFITEHYWGYTRQRDGGTMEYRVEHPQWRVWPAHNATLGGDVAGFYPVDFASALSDRLSSAFVADGSAVSVWGGARVRGSRR